MKYRIVILIVSLILLLPGSSWSVDEVIPQTGGVTFTQTDHYLPTPLGPVPVERSYYESKKGGILGPHWSIDIVSSLESLEDKRIILRQGYRKSILVESDDKKYYTGVGGIAAQADGDRWIVTSPANITSIYNGNGQEVSRSDANGNAVSFKYDAKGRLTEIQAVKNHSLHLIYHQNGLLAALQGSSGRKSAYFYTGNGYLEKVKDPDNRETTYTYTKDGQLSGIHYPSGEKVNYTYDENGKIIERTSSTGLLLKYTYGPSTKVTRHDGYWRETEFDERGLPLTYRDSLKREQAWSWNSRGLIQKRTFLDGSISTYSYDELDRLTRQESDRGDYLTLLYERTSDRPLKTDLNGAIYQFTYDKRGNLLSAVSPAGRKVSYRYDNQGRISVGIDGEGRTTKYEYDVRGNLIKQYNPDGGITTWEYDQNGRVTAERDPLGNATGYAYHSNGLLASITRPGGARIAYEYDNHGRMSQETYGTLSIRYIYDTKGMLSRVEYPGKTSEQFSYDSLGNLVKHINTAGRVTQRKFDHAGRLLQIELPSGLSVGQSYGKSGIPEQLTIGQSKFTFSQDKEDNIVVLTDPAKVETRLKRDSRGLITLKVLPGGGKEQRWYDADGFLEAMVLPMGDVWRFSHSGAGQIKTITYPFYPEGKQLTFSYDPAGRLASIKDPSGQLASYRYNIAGMLIESTNARGKRISYEYNQDGNMTRRRTPEADWRYTYDAIGNLTQASNGSYSARYSYDSMGRLTKVEYPEWKKSVRYSYDTLGRLAARTDPDGNQVRITYDEPGRVSKIAGTDGKSFVFSYDKADRLVQRKAPNGTTTKFVYDDIDRIMSIAHTNAGGTLLTSCTYRYDAVGNVIAVTDMKGSEKTYRYDREQRLIEETGSSGTIKYVYGPGGNRFLVDKDSGLIKYQYNESGRLVRAGKDLFVYDADGNLVKQKTKGGTTRYRYDAGNNLAEVKLPDGTTVKYGYGPFGERIWREKNGKRQNYLFDGDNVLQELTETYQASRTYLFAGLDRPLMILGPDGMTVFHEDALGSIIALSNDDGRISAHYTYDAFGKVIQRDGSAASQTFLFTSRPVDPALQLYNLRARFYDPTIGRFISRDPVIGDIDDPVTLAPYLYARNNPLSYVDHTGEKPQKANPSRSDKVGNAIKKYGPSVSSGIAFVPKAPPAVPLRPDFLGTRSGVSIPAGTPVFYGRPSGGLSASYTKGMVRKTIGAFRTYRTHVNLNPTRTLGKYSTYQTAFDVFGELTVPVVNVVIGEEPEGTRAVEKTLKNVVVKGAPIAGVAVVGKGLAMAFPKAAAALAPAAPVAIGAAIVIGTADRTVAAVDEGIKWRQAEKQFQTNLQVMKQQQAGLKSHMSVARSALGQMVETIKAIKKRMLELIKERAWIEQQLKDQGSKKQEMVKGSFKKTLDPIQKRLPQMEAQLKKQDMVFPVVEPFAEVIEKIADDGCEALRKRGDRGIEFANKKALEAETEAEKLKKKITPDSQYDSTIQTIDDLITEATSKESEANTMIDNAKGEIEWIESRVDRIWKNYEEFQGLRTDVQKKQGDLMRHIKLLETQLKTIKGDDGRAIYSAEDRAALESFKRAVKTPLDDMGAPLNANEYMSGMDIETATAVLEKITAFKSKASDLKAKIEKQKDFDRQLKERINAAVARAKTCASREDPFAGTWNGTFTITKHSMGAEIGMSGQGVFTIKKSGTVYSVEGLGLTKVNLVTVSGNILKIEGMTRTPVQVDTPKGTVTYEVVTKDTIRLRPGADNRTLTGTWHTDFIKEGRVDEWHEQSVWATRQ